jgi:hypothetical protein
MPKDHIPGNMKSNEFNVSANRDFNAPKISIRKKPKIKLKKSNRGFG